LLASFLLINPRSGKGSPTADEAAIDREPDVLETPVEFRVEPGALRVLVPPAESG
jgi:hypothetical protein